LKNENRLSVSAPIWIDNFVNLFYPRVCNACGRPLFRSEEVICTRCLFRLPQTNFHLHKENPISRIFWGRVPIYSATSFLFFNKGGKVQHLIHRLKYKRKPEVGIYLGRQLGFQLMDSPLFREVDIILPVPLHPKKEYELRLAELKEYIKKYKKIKIIEGIYKPKEWFKLIKGLENEPERGKRCDICYQMRLATTAKFAKENNFDFFASSLSISPHKKANKLSELGQLLAQKYQIKFFDRDWKKKDGFKISCQISRQENFYRQNYCGCIYSKLERENKKIRSRKI